METNISATPRPSQALMPYKCSEKELKS